MKDLDKTVGKSLVGFYEQYLINKYGKDEEATYMLKETLAPEGYANVLFSPL